LALSLAALPPPQAMSLRALALQISNQNQFERQ
jgi:hypothetical protein